MIPAIKTVSEFLDHIIINLNRPEVQEFLKRVSFGVNPNIKLTINYEKFINTQIKWYEVPNQYNEDLSFLHNPNTVNSFVTAINSLH